MTRLMGFDGFGAGPAVVLLHPSGFGPGLLRPFARTLSTRYRVIVPHRRGYGDSAALAPPSSLDELHDDLAALITELGLDRPVIVGASSGATLTVGFLRRHPGLAGGGVAHEPLLGPLGGPLHAVVAERIADLLDQADEPYETSLFMTSLVGLPAWNALREDCRLAVERHGAITRAEAALFATFAVDADELRALAPVLDSTVGELSPELRHELATVLREHGITTTVLPGAAHLPMLEAPAEWAEAIAAVVTRTHGTTVGRPVGPVEGATA